MSAEQLEIRITGADRDMLGATDITPADIDYGDFLVYGSHILRAVRGAIEPNAGEPELSFSLVELRENCATLVFRGNRPAVRSFQLIATILAAAAFARLRRECWEGLAGLSEQAGAQKLVFDFDPLAQVVAAEAATISPARPVPVVPPLAPRTIQGETSIYGTVNRVGGRRKPGAEIHLTSGGTLDVHLSSQAMAEELGKLLYREVCLYGYATWKITEGDGPWELTTFEAIRRVPYTPTGISDAVDALAEAFPDAWRGVDVDEYLRGFRNEGVGM
jgi:hypothetical protein